MSAFEAHRGGGGFPQAIEIAGAGTAQANGIYRATDRLYCDAPVYEHMGNGADLKITREPHTNSKTGVTKHGWLLGIKAAPLYGVPTEALIIPAAGWKRFTGESPVPNVMVYDQLTEVFYSSADAAKAKGDVALEQEDWSTARDAFTSGIDALKRSGERFGDAFRNRAALLLARRAGANLNAAEHQAALRDAIAALELVRSLTSAEMVAVQAAKALGCRDDAVVQRMLELVGGGKILDSGAPLVLRCVERWVRDLVALWEAGDFDSALPDPKQMPADRYLDGMDEKDREAVLKKHLPEFFMPPGGTGIVKDPTECLKLMKTWEDIFSSQEFQQKRKDLWTRQGLNFPQRLQATRSMVVEALADVLEPMGFAPGQPGLTRVVRQMQVYWSGDKQCASKALDLEELADVSLADLIE